MTVNHKGEVNVERFYTLVVWDYDAEGYYISKRVGSADRRELEGRALYYTYKLSFVGAAVYYDDEVVSSYGLVCD